MDPRFNGEWSVSEVEAVKSLIARCNTNNDYANDLNKKHTDITDELHAMFPLKEKRQVTNLYVELVVQMMHTMQTSKKHVAASSNLMGGNFGIPVEDPTKHGSLVEEMGVMRREDELPKKQLTPRKERQQSPRFWTKEEHK